MVVGETAWTRRGGWCDARLDVILQAWGTDPSTNSYVNYVLCCAVPEDPPMGVFPANFGSARVRATSYDGNVRSPPAPLVHMAV